MNTLMALTFLELENIKSENTYDTDNPPLHLAETIQGNTCTQSDNPVCTLVCMLCNTPSCDMRRLKKFNIFVTF